MEKYHFMHMNIHSNTFFFPSAASLVFSGHRTRQRLFAPITVSHIGFV